MGPHPSLEGLVVGNFIMYVLYGVWTCNYDNFNWEQTFLGKGSLNTMLRKSTFGTSFMAIRFEKFELSIVFNQELRHEPRLNTLFGMSSLCMPRLLGLGWLNWSSLVPTQPRPSSKVSSKLGGRGMSFVNGIGWESLGIGNANVCKLVRHFGWLLGALGVVLGQWGRLGWSLAWWLGRLSLVGP